MKDQKLSCELENYNIATKLESNFAPLFMAVYDKIK